MCKFKVKYLIKNINTNRQRETGSNFDWCWTSAWSFSKHRNQLQLTIIKMWNSNTSHSGLHETSNSFPNVYHRNSHIEKIQKYCATRVSVVHFEVKVTEQVHLKLQMSQVHFLCLKLFKYCDFHIKNFLTQQKQVLKAV